MVRKNDWKRIVIICDFHAALRSLMSDKALNTNNLLATIFDNCKQMLSKGSDVSLHWVPAHCSVYGNEIADKVAKKAVERESVDILEERTR